MSVIDRQTAMPEWLTRHDTVNGAWTIEAGLPARGGAWTNITERRMSVPHGNDELSRLIRAHEMVHAKVTPKTLFMDGRYGVTNDSLIAAEELRVNTLVGIAGFPINELADGSEGTAGEVFGKNKDWNAAVRALASCVGTKGASAMIRGVRKHDEAMANSLNELSKILKKTVKKMAKINGKYALGSTIPSVAWTNIEETDVSHPSGWANTINIAKILDSQLISEGSEVIPTRQEMSASIKGERGRFADLLEMKVPKPEKVDGKLGRRRVACDSGRNPRRVNRMLTDPDHKVFDRRIKGRGGVILIDQSGSMNLKKQDIWEMIKLAPGCVIIGYSHSPGSVGVPNVWVMANRGSVCSEIPDSNSGNGVDGPAIRFAAKHVRSGEPFIWVCDGIVTDGDNDRQFENLVLECVGLVREHKIHMVKSVPAAVDALKVAASGKRLDVSFVGPLRIASSRH